MIRRAGLVALLLLTTASPACLQPSPIVVEYEDGSYVRADGSTGCHPWGLCYD